MAEQEDLSTMAGRLSQSNSLRAQSAKFIITGGISAVVDLGTTWLLQIVLGVLGETGARSVGFVAGTLTAYLLNRKWTFNARPNLRRLLAVAATYALTFLVNITLYRWGFGFLDHRLEWPSTPALVVAYAVSQGLATFVNFWVQRWIIFRSTRKSFEVN